MKTDDLQNLEAARIESRAPDDRGLKRAAVALAIPTLAIMLLLLIRSSPWLTPGSVVRNTIRAESAEFHLITTYQGVRRSQDRAVPPRLVVLGLDASGTISSMGRDRAVSGRGEFWFHTRERVSTTIEFIEHHGLFVRAPEGEWIEAGYLPGAGISDPMGMIEAASGDWEWDRSEWSFDDGRPRKFFAAHTTIDQVASSSLSITADGLTRRLISVRTRMTVGPQHLEERTESTLELSSYGSGKTITRPFIGISPDKLPEEERAEWCFLASLLSGSIRTPENCPF